MVKPSTFAYANYLFLILNLTFLSSIIITFVMTFATEIEGMPLVEWEENIQTMSDYKKGNDL